MDGLISSGNKRTYTDFKKQIPKNIIPLFDTLREFCLSLGEKTIEDVRMHRVVFCKSFTFRWFADMEPQKDHIIIKIQKNRKESVIINEISLESDITNIKKTIQNAYESIH